MPRKIRCDSCQLVRINGVVTHEIGCPDAWKSYLRDCKLCGEPFRPKHSRQEYCQRCLRDEFH